MFPPPVDGQLNGKLSTAMRTGRGADTPVGLPSHGLLSGGADTSVGPPSSPEFGAGTVQLNSASIGAISASRLALPARTSRLLASTSRK